MFAKCAVGTHRWTGLGLPLMVVKYRSIVINTMLALMKLTNTAVINSTTDFLNAIIARNILLYDKPKGLVSVANEVKFYVKSVFGSSASEYREVRSIKFTRRKLS